MLQPEEFRRQGALFQIPFWGHISAVDQVIFTKFGVYVDNWVAQRAKWSKYAFLYNPKWPLLDRRLSDLAEILQDDTRVKASTLKPKVEFFRQGAFLRILFWGHIFAADQDIFTKFGL